MAQNFRPNLGFEKDDILVQHGIFALLVDTLNKLIQVKYCQSSLPLTSPYETHKRIMSAFLALVFIYATASAAEVILRTQESVYHKLVGNIRLFAIALATVLLMVVLAPLLGYCTISLLWACLFVTLAFESCQGFYQLLTQIYPDMLKKLLESVRGNVEEPS